LLDELQFRDGSATEDLLDELQLSFEQSDAEWYLGAEGGAGWAAAVEAGTPRLLALSLGGAGGAGGDDSAGEQDSARGAGRAGVALRARVASLLPRAEYQVAQLNGAGVRALWAARGLERAWLGGEEEGGEEEPYSLTASAVLLRRLSAEAAPPPLGRPVFEATFLARAID
jgi:hypothetical protein